MFPLSESVICDALTPLGISSGPASIAYANAGINTAGRIVEVVSGMPYELKFVQKRPG